MDNRLKKLLIAVLVLLLLVFVFLFVKNCNKQEDGGEGGNDTAISLCAYENTQIAKITYTNQYGTFAFECNNGVWVYAEDNAFPVNQTTLNNIATSVSGITALRDISDQSENEEKYGLSDGAVTLMVTYNDGATQNFIFGLYNTNGSGSYVKTNGGLYIASTGLGTSLDLPLFDMAKTNEPSVFAKESVVSVTLNGTEYTDSEVISAYLDKYNLVYALGVEDYKNKESYGFDSSENSLIFKYKTSQSSTLEDGTTVQTSVENEYEFKFVVKESNQYFMLPDDSIIYSASGADALLKVEVADQTETTEE